MSRWEVLQSLLRVPKFICIHLSWQSKTWSVNHSVTPLQGGLKTPVAVLHIWKARDEVPEDKTHVDLPVKPDINSFWQDGLTESFPVRLSVDIPLCFIHLCRSRLRDAQPGRKLGSFWRGVTESGALDSSLSFLNRLSVGKAMANAPHSQVSSYKPSGCIEQLHAFSRGWPHGSYPKPHAPVNQMNEPRWHSVGSTSETETAKAGTPTATPEVVLYLSTLLSFNVWNNLGNSKALLPVITLSHSNLFFGFSQKKWFARTYLLRKARIYDIYPKRWGYESWKTWSFEKGYE